MVRLVIPGLFDASVDLLSSVALFVIRLLETLLVPIVVVLFLAASDPNLGCIFVDTVVAVLAVVGLGGIVGIVTFLVGNLDCC